MQTGDILFRTSKKGGHLPSILFRARASHCPNRSSCSESLETHYVVYLPTTLRQGQQAKQSSVLGSEIVSLGLAQHGEKAEAGLLLNWSRNQSQLWAEPKAAVHPHTCQARSLPPRGLASPAPLHRHLLEMSSPYRPRVLRLDWQVAGQRPQVAAVGEGL